MRPTIPIVAGLILSVAVVPRPAAAQTEPTEDAFQHGRIRFVEPGVTVQRATEVAAEEAVANLPFLPGDRVWTAEAGRAEFQFPDGTIVRLDRQSKLDYSGHDPQGQGRVMLRLWSGHLVVRPRVSGGEVFEVETPSGVVRVLAPGLVRVDVDGGETRLSVYQGEASFDDGEGGAVRVAEGERTVARWGEPAQPAERFSGAAEDDFASWDAGREADERWAAAPAEHLPSELSPYAGEFERNGDWRYEAEVGYVWAPRVTSGWQPYSNGYWTWTPYGWTWVPYESWGWVPSHYGRWGFSLSFGWYWVPGRTWGPAWVSWGIGGGYVGWCPLGRYDRPVFGWSHDHYGSHDRYRGHAVPRGYRDRTDGWSVVREGELGGRGLARRRVAPGQLSGDTFRIADSPRLRPTRDVQRLGVASASARAISRRPSPGDFVRELAVDNKTTIPAPWVRRSDAAAHATGADRQSRGETVGTWARTTGREQPRLLPSSPQAERPAAESRRTSPARPWTTIERRDPAASTPPSGRAERRAPTGFWERPSQGTSRSPSRGESRSESYRSRPLNNGSQTESHATRTPTRGSSSRPSSSGGTAWRSRSDNGSSARSSGSGASRSRPSSSSSSRSSGARSSGSRSSSSSSGSNSSGSRGHSSARPR
jgi:hypothetical protein